MIKRIALYILTILFIISGMQVNAANSQISVTVDDVQVIFDVAPQIIDNRVMVPIRAIFESMGATVVWDNDRQRAYCKKESTEVEVVLNFPYLWVDNDLLKMDCSPILINDRILVPARYAAEAFGYEVEWVHEKSLVEITSGNSFDASKIVYYENFSDVPDFGSCTEAVFVTNTPNAYAYYGLSDSYNEECISKYKKILKKLSYVEVRENLFKCRNRTVLIHVGSTGVGKMIFIMIDPSNT